MPRILLTHFEISWYRESCQLLSGIWELNLQVLENHTPTKFPLYGDLYYKCNAFESGYVLLCCHAYIQSLCEIYLSIE